jgi:hypothetical protein
MSRRSAREKPQKTAASLPDNVKRGLSSIIAGNEAVISGMLDIAADSDLFGALVDVLAVNSLSAEGLLAQWFSAPLLSAYASAIGKSPKGNEIALAARIAAAWARSDFQPPAELADGTGAANAAAAGPPAGQLLGSLAGLGDSDSDSEEERPPKRSKPEPSSASAEAAAGEAAAAAADPDEAAPAAAAPGPVARVVRGVTNSQPNPNGEGIQYKVRWKGCEKSDDSWVSEGEVTAAQIGAFEAKKASKMKQKGRE